MIVKLRLKIMNGSLDITETVLNYEKETNKYFFYGNQSEGFKVKKEDFGKLLISNFQDLSNIFVREAFVTLQDKNRVIEEFKTQAKENFKKHIEQAQQSIEALSEKKENYDSQLMDY